MNLNDHGEDDGVFFPAQASSSWFFSLAFTSAGVRPSPTAMNDAHAYDNKVHEFRIQPGALSNSY